MKRRDRNRGRLEIVADILSVAESGSSKTRIMYQANLSYRLLIRYLDMILKAGLVYLNDSSEYVTTAKGRDFLEKFRKYSKRVDHVLGDRVVLESMCSGSKPTEAESVKSLAVNVSE